MESLDPYYPEDKKNGLDWFMLIHWTYPVDIRGSGILIVTTTRPRIMIPGYGSPPCIVGVKTVHAYIATKVANIIWGKNGPVCPRVVVVDDVLHAFATKYHPIKGTTVVYHSNTSP